MADTTKPSHGWLWIVVAVIVIMAVTAWVRRPVAESLQLMGGGLQLVGVVTVALEIARKRREFTGKESIVRRALRGGKRAWDRFRGKRRPVVQGTISATLPAVTSKARVHVGWENALPLEERIQKIQSRIDEQWNSIADLRERLDAEEADRKALDERQTRERENLRHLLEERIGQAAAGGLTIETWGATLFALGIILAAVGASGLVE